MGVRCVAFCIIINYVFFCLYLLCLNKRSVNEIFYNYFQYISKGADISFDDPLPSTSPPPPLPHHTFCLLLFIGKRFTIWGSLGNCLWTPKLIVLPESEVFFCFFFAILTWIIIENWYENERWNIILWNKFNWNPFPNILWKIWKFNYKELTIEIHRFPDHIYIHISM